MRRIGVIGSMVWDVIYGRDARTSPVEEWGGIAYGLGALDAALPDDWQIVPLIKVGADLTPRARLFFRTLRRMDPAAAPIEVAERNNRVELRYVSAERRSEMLQGGVPPWSWAGLRPLLRGIDALYVNLISGFELDLTTAQLIRQHFTGPIYCDLHSLVLSVRADGLRVPQARSDVAAWCACFDFVQVNEDEMQLLAADPMEMAAVAMREGVSTLVVTLGQRGVAYFAAPGFSQLSDRFPSGASQSFSAPVRSARIPVASSAIAQDGDPTGCGDVFGATFFARMVGGDMLTLALERGVDAAARNAKHRGASGLAAYLRGEISST